MQEFVQMHSCAKMENKERENIMDQTNLRDAYEYAEEPLHKNLIRAIKPSLSFDTQKDYHAWKKELYAKFMELSGLDMIEAGGDCDPKLEIE